MNFSDFISSTNCFCLKCLGKLNIDYSKSFYKLSFNKIAIDIDPKENLFTLSYHESSFSDTDTILVKIKMDTSEILEIKNNGDVNTDTILNDFLVGFSCFRCYFDKNQRYGFNVNYKVKINNNIFTSYLYSYNFVYLSNNCTYLIENNFDANNITINKKSPNTGVNLSVSSTAVPLHFWDFRNEESMIKAMNTLFLLI